MIFTLWVIFGVLAGLVTIALARRFDLEAMVFSVSLLIAAGWYLLFGVVEGRDYEALTPQILGALYFCVCSVLGFRNTLILSIGWFSHIAWDISSPHFSDVEYMPFWTVPACLGFDVLIGAYLLARFRGKYPIHDELVIAKGVE